MTKNVLVTISGIQFDVGDEAIELITMGTYYFKNGKHYVLFEEQPDSDGPVTKNIVKFNDNYYEMLKKGGSHSYLLFQNGQKTSTVYDTPMGPVQIDVVTYKFSVTETEQELTVQIQYTLYINCDFISECEVNFKVQAR